MKPFRYMLAGWTAALLGCSSPEPPPVYLKEAPIVVERDDGSREIILFPEYFLQEGYRLNEHGHIPRTNLIGAGFTTAMDLATVRVQISDLLHARGWETGRMEVGRQFFRIQASRSGELVEIRAVQGMEGPTELFLLYTPAPEQPKGR